MILWLLAAILCLFFINTVGDNGDGIMHYLFARYAHLHADNFLNPWAKTGFTLLAWPFAQLGLKGMMVMNILFVLANMWLVYNIAEKLGIKHPVIASVVMSLCTSYFLLMYSGLTEHAFSFILMLSIYLLLYNRWLLGTFILSTLPFFRQEGYIIIASLLPYYFANKKARIIPLLATSFVLVAIAGAIKYNQFLWILNTNPYSNKVPYGSGSLFTFFNYLYYHHGLVNLVFFIVGIVAIIFLPNKNKWSSKLNTALLILFPFLLFFLSHVVFWYWGIFHSMGLQRVLNCVVPLFAIIAAIGFSKLSTIFTQKASRLLALCLFTIMFVFPFLPSPSNINFKKDFTKKPFDEKLEEVCLYAQTNYNNRYIYFGHPMVPYLLNIDPFDDSICLELVHLEDTNPKQGALLIWDNKLTRDNSGISEAGILADERLIKIQDVQLQMEPYRIILFEVK